jgi:hypothetical protein
MMPLSARRLGSDEARWKKSGEKAAQARRMLDLMSDGGSFDTRMAVYGVAVGEPMFNCCL